MSNFVGVMARMAGKTDKGIRSISVPRRYVPVGSVFRCGDAEYQVVLRDRVRRASDACRGCAFASGFCPSVQCSSFDREDGQMVWFVRVE